MFQEEVARVKQLLEQSEFAVRESEERHARARQEVQKLTELKLALQQDAGASHGSLTDTQVGQAGLAHINPSFNQLNPLLVNTQINRSWLSISIIYNKTLSI